MTSSIEVWDARTMKVFHSNLRAHRPDWDDRRDNPHRNNDRFCP
jgi:hypothetical protein